VWLGGVTTGALNLYWRSSAVPEETLSQPEAQTASSHILLRVTELKKYFPVRQGFLQRRVGWIKAVDGVSFTVQRGETFGLVGERGSGKSTLGRVILQLYPATAGRVYFEDQDLTKLRGQSLRRMRRRMQMVFQDPYASLNPHMTVGELIGEPLDIQGAARGAEKNAQVEHLLQAVGLHAYFARRFPHEFSGGQRQGISLARALALKPALIVCDELSSRLDPALRPRLVERLKNLQMELDLTYLLLERNLHEVRDICDSVAVMYLGRLMELAGRDELFKRPLHPYTQHLLSRPAVEAKPRSDAGSGAPGSTNPPKGCLYNALCPFAIERCYQEEPVWRELLPNHWVYCHRAEAISAEGAVSNTGQ
jgi:oligopeptide transport system ATP-binding protein